jgi:hypothetical protein
MTRNAKNCALYYHRHRDAFLKRKVLRLVRARGTVPRRSTCDRLNIDIAEVAHAWSMCAEPRQQVKMERLLDGW